MIELEFVERLIRALDASNLDSLELERGGTRIRLSKSPVPCMPFSGGTGAGVTHHAAPAVSPSPALASAASVPEPGRPEEPKGWIQVTSPMVGTFYRSPAPDAPPYVEVGKTVGPGEVLCIIEAMKLMNELESEVSGTVVKVLVENAQPVEYGQVLFLIDPS